MLIKCGSPKLRGKSIIVEGIIASGKSVLTVELAEALGNNTIHFTEPDEKESVNPYLEDYYVTPDRWSFTIQTHLLGLRYQIHQYAAWHVLTTGGYAVIDRSLPGDVSFAHLQRQMGLMTDREFKTYSKLYHIMMANVHLPNVCIRLLVTPETAMQRIAKRMKDETGRTCETRINIQYLKDLDREISHMVGVLQKQGVVVLDVPWDVERETPESRKEAIQGLIHRINDIVPTDPFLDLHRRTM